MLCNISYIKPREHIELCKPIVEAYQDITILDFLVMEDNL